MKFGDAADQVEPKLLDAIATGIPILNFELTAELPVTKGKQSWISHFFSTKDEAGNVHSA